MIIPLMLGLLSSLHCVAMCGPIALSLPVHQFKSSKKTLAIILYHLGRLLVYVCLGLIFGAIGKGLFIAGLQQKLSIVLGVLLIVVVFLNENKFQNNILSNGKWYIKFKSLFGNYIQKRTLSSFLVLGMLNGLLPCAMIYMALFGATATQGTFYGGMFMFWFGLGTMPLLTLIISMRDVINSFFKKKLQRVVPFFLMITGLLLILRGLDLDVPYLSPSSLQLFISANPQCF